MAPKSVLLAASERRETLYSAFMFPSWKSEIEIASRILAAWCRERDYAGPTPFDALTSTCFMLAIKTSPRRPTLDAVFQPSSVTSENCPPPPKES